MMEMIEGSGEAREERDDLLSSLLAANQEEVKGVKLDNCELLGNTQSFLRPRSSCTLRRQYLHISGRRA
jgi:hypothetical protein